MIGESAHALKADIKAYSQMSECREAETIAVPSWTLTPARSSLAGAPTTVLL
jgi:hypothetical protein